MEPHRLLICCTKALCGMQTRAYSKNLWVPLNSCWNSGPKNFHLRDNYYLLLDFNWDCPYVRALSLCKRLSLCPLVRAHNNSETWNIYNALVISEKSSNEEGRQCPGEFHNKMEMLHIESCYQENARRYSRAGSLFSPRADFGTTWGAAGSYGHLGHLGGAL